MNKVIQTLKIKQNLYNLFLVACKDDQMIKWFGKALEAMFKDRENGI